MLPTGSWHLVFLAPKRKKVAGQMRLQTSIMLIFTVISKASVLLNLLSIKLFLDFWTISYFQYYEVPWPRLSCLHLTLFPVFVLSCVSPLPLTSLVVLIKAALPFLF
jgi:hypothetical protein